MSVFSTRLWAPLGKDRPITLFPASTMPDTSNSIYVMDDAQKTNSEWDFKRPIHSHRPRSSLTWDSEFWIQKLFNNSNRNKRIIAIIYWELTSSIFMPTLFHLIIEITLWNGCNNPFVLNRGSMRLNNLPKITQLIKIKTQFVISGWLNTSHLTFLRVGPSLCNCAKLIISFQTMTFHIWL